MTNHKNKRFIWLSTPLILAIFLGLFLVVTFTVRAAPVTQDFDGLSESSYGDYTYQGWEITNGLCNATNARSGNAVRLRNATTSLVYVGADGNGKDGGLGTISFWYRAWDGSPTAVYQVQYKQGAGAWINIGSQISTNSTTYAEFSEIVNIGGDDILVQVIRISGERLHIDDVALTDYTAGLTINKDASPSNIGYHENVTYTVVLDNPTIISDTNVLFTDTLPTEVDFASWVDQPTGASVTADEITWSGTVTATEAITFTFVVTHSGNYGEVVTNTAVFSGTLITGTAEAGFSVATATSDITFVYHDLEDVVQTGESVYIAGDFNSWSITATVLNADAGNETFSVTVPTLTSGDYNYKYIVYTDTVPTGPAKYDWLNTNNRSYTVAGSATVDNYRNVVVGWANLQWPFTLNTETFSTTETVYGRVFINTVTDPVGEGRGIMAEVGFGDDANTALWNWFSMSYNSDDAANDEFMGTMTTAGDVGVFSYTTRFDGNWGIGNPNAAWAYGSPTGVMTSTLGNSSADILIINELDSDTSGTEDDEFIELYDGGVGNTDLTDLVLVLYNGNGDKSYRALDLDGYNTTGDGYFVICSSTAVPNCDLDVGSDYFLQNGPDAAALYVGDATDFPNDTPVTTANLVDAIVYDTNDSDDSGLLVLLNPGQPQVNENSNGTGYEDSNQRCPDGAGGARNTINYIQELPTAGATNDCPPLSLLITKSAPALVEPGELYTYTLTIENNLGYDLTSVVITDVLPISSTYASGGMISGDTVSWAVPSLPNFTSIDRTFAVTATMVDGTAIENLDYGVNASNYTTTTYGMPVYTAVAGSGCGAAFTPIYTIQGNGPSSPVDGDEVFTEGVVTAVFQGADQLNGFYIQDETGDGDVTTSDGIFVYSNAPITVTDVVRVRGFVDEYYNLTEITGVSSVLVCGTGTITPTAVSLPVSTLDTWEQYEGMLLEFPQGLYATETYNLGRYGEVSLSVNDRLYNPTNITTPGAAAIAQQELNDRSRIQLDDTYTNQNRDPIAYPDPGLSYTNTLRGGDYVANLTGVLDYAFGNYKVQPVGTVDFTVANTRTVAAEDVGGSLKVASFNVLNYFNGDGMGGGFPTPRGADTPSEFARQRVKIVNAIVAMDADIIGLMEIENDGYDSLSAIQDLVDGLNTATSAGTYAFVDPGVSTIGTDAIAVGLLYKPASVILAGSPEILDSSVISTFNDDKNRPVLTQSFTDNVYSQTVTIAVNHFKSKGSDCDSLGDPDEEDGQGNCNLTRTSAAEALAGWLATDPTNSGSPYSMIIGDLNAYAMEDPIVAITDAGYTNLLSQFGGLYAYSYVYSGQHGYLDHALSSSALTPFVTGATTWHINSDEPRALDYNDYNLSYLYQPGPYRASDHDPVVVGLNMLNISISSPTDNADFIAPNNITATVPVTVSTPGFDIPTDGHWHLYVDGTPMGAIMGYTTTLQLPLGEHTITAELRDPSHAPLGPTDIVTVTVSPADGIIVLDPMDDEDFIAANNITATVPVTVSTPGFTIPTDGHWHLYVDGTPMGAIMGYTTTLELPLGEHTITAELRDPSHTPLGPTDTVTFTVSPADGIIITSPISGTEFIAMDNVSVTVPITVATPGFDVASSGGDGHWHIWLDGSMDHMVYDYGTELLLPVGEHTIMAQLVDNAHQPLGSTDTVTITVRPWQDKIIYLPIIMK